MLESAIEFLSSVPWYWVLLSALFFTILENVFPPSPSDSVIIFTGTLVGIGVISLIPLLIAATIGSILGFALMFYLGSFIGDRIIKSDKFPFINKDNIEKPSRWLNKYGYYIIGFNRFLSGTRGVISFLAGMAKMPPAPTIALASISALIWNLILIYLGIILGNNWRIADEYVEIYGWFILPVILLLIIVPVARYLYKYFKN
ncbi:DedA family protein [Bacteroidota bacterium]